MLKVTLSKTDGPDIFPRCVIGDTIGRTGWAQEFRKVGPFVG
jgi:hypothetical protein